MGQVPPKYFLPSSPYGSSPAASALNPVQPAAVNPQTPLLPPTFSDPGTMATQSPKPTNPVAPIGRGSGPLRGLFGLLLLLFAPSLWATTAVTGTLQNLGTQNVTNGAFVRFWLRGCGGNIPRVNGVAVIAPSQGGVYFFDFAANASGQISGTLYSTRDVTGNLGGDIECGGSKTAVWYGMQVYVGGKGASEVPIHAKNTSTIDISNVTPINTFPVSTAPNPQGTFLRLDGGNSPLTGPVTSVSTISDAGGTHTGADNLNAGGTLSGIFTGNRTETGNNTHSGTETFTGTVTSGTLDSIIFVDGVKYTTIASALAACPAAPAPCRVYVPAGTYTTTGFTLGAAPCQSLYSQVLELDPGAKIQTTGKINLLCGASIYGWNRDSSQIIAVGGFPASTPLIDMGDNVNDVDARLEGIFLNCGNQAGCTTIRARGLNEDSYIGRILMENYLANCISIDGTTVGTENFLITDFSCQGGAGAGDAFLLNNTASLHISRGSIVSNINAQMLGAGIHTTGTGNNLNAGIVLESIHTEHVTDALLLDGALNVTAINVDTGNSGVNTLHIAGTATGSLYAINTHNYGNSGGFPVIKNDVTTTNLSSSTPPSINTTIAEYRWQKNGVEFWSTNTGFSNNTGLQLFNTTTTCTTGNTVGATCTTAAITLPVAEADTNYRVVCTGKGLTNVPVVIATTNTSGTQFTITIAALTAAAASFSSYDCTVGHN